LPISSTGHMILASKLMGIAADDFTKSFEIIIQFGSILAVVVLYWRRIWNGGKDLWKRVFTAFLPTAIIGFLLYKVLKDYLLGNAVIVVWAFAIGGVALILFELWYKKRVQISSDRVNSVLTYKQSFITGLAQALAIIPGVSRSGATIIAGMAMGISREAIVEFSFLLAIPTMAAATGYDLLKTWHTFSLGQADILLVGFVISFIAAMLSVKWLIGFVKNHTFVSFGVYRILVAIIFYLLVIKV